jgi:hypothetical protein
MFLGHGLGVVDVVRGEPCLNLAFQCRPLGDAPVENIGRTASQDQSSDCAMSSQLPYLGV